MPSCCGTPACPSGPSGCEPVSTGTSTSTSTLPIRRAECNLPYNDDDDDGGWKHSINEEGYDDFRFLFLEVACTTTTPASLTATTDDPLTRAFLDLSTVRVRCSDGEQGGEKARDEIESGAYHGIVVVVVTDQGAKSRGLLPNENEEEEEVTGNAFHEFETELAPRLRLFVKSGGVVAFVLKSEQDQSGSDGASGSASNGGSVTTTAKWLVTTLTQWFDVTWKLSDVTSTSTSLPQPTTWVPSPLATVRESFAHSGFRRNVWEPYEARGAALTNVPTKERCFFCATAAAAYHRNGCFPEGEPTATSTYLRHSRHDNEKDNSNGSDDNKDDPDLVMVALHDYGAGCVGYFGDVHCTRETSDLVRALVRSRAPKDPQHRGGVDYSDTYGLDDDAFGRVTHLKEQGNRYFQTGHWDEAAQCYRDAVRWYQHSTTKTKGLPGLQRETHVTLWSNLALVAFRQSDWHRSEHHATRALRLDPHHAKSRFRRAAARHRAASSIHKDDPTRVTLLRAAQTDLRDLSTSAKSAESASSVVDPQQVQRLRQRIDKELHAIEQTSVDTFRSNLAGAF